MTNEDKTALPRKISGYIAKKRLRDAFGSLRVYSGMLGDWRVTDKIDHLEQSYRMMLGYASEGVADPKQKEMYDMIVSGIYSITDRISYEMSKPKSPSIYFSTVRYEELQSDSDISMLAERYRKALSDSSIYNFITGGNSNRTDALKAKEELERRLFNKIWVSYPLTADNMESIRQLFSAEDVPQYAKELFISAILLGLLQYYEEPRLHMLVDFYESDNLNLSTKALVAFLMGLYVNRDKISGSKLQNRIEHLRDSGTWSQDVTNIFMQFIKSRETERINKKMRDELIPGMMKLRGDISKTVKDISSIEDIAGIEENPEWQEMLDKAGLTDKIKELSKLQEDGADVFMSTFSGLKQYPFFNDVSNWFLPFHSDNTAVSGALGGGAEGLTDIMARSSFFCDGDKYSFILTLNSVPEFQRQMMLSQFNSSEFQDGMRRSAELITNVQEKEGIANRYVQDIYRFFKLFRRRGDFRDPFERPLNLLQVELLDKDFTDADTLTLVSEFYFRHSYFEDALSVFKKLEDSGRFSAQLYQKMGYCCQQCGDIEDALTYYSQAELLNADSLWTMKRLAAVHRLLGHPKEALEYYKKVELKRPDDLNVALNIGHCALELKDYDEALNYYYKVEFLDEKSNKAWRPLAWTLFLKGDYAQSHKYYDMIVADKPTSTDYLNMGHLSLAEGNIKEAINYYCLSVSVSGNDTETFIKSLNADYGQLALSGISKDTIPLVIDAVLYRFND